jgi:hypothetical protein
MKSFGEIELLLGVYGIPVALACSTTQAIFHSWYPVCDYRCATVFSPRENVPNGSKRPTRQDSGLWYVYRLKYIFLHPTMTSIYIPNTTMNTKKYIPATS